MTAKPAAALTDEATPNQSITIRVSSAGDCKRRLLLEHKGIAGGPPWQGRDRAFEEGNMHEPSILAWAAENLPNGPWTLFDRQREIVVLRGPGIQIIGHQDALATNGSETVLLEAKALSKWSFQEFREKGVAVSHPQYHTQVQLYMHGQQKRRKHRPQAAYVVARNKETVKDRYWDMHWERVEYDPAFCASVIADLVELAGLMRTGADIAPPFHPDTHWQCHDKWCPYALDCHPDYQKPVELADRDEDLLPVIERYQELGSTIKELGEERDALKVRLEGNAILGPIMAGTWRVELEERPRESFDTKLARRELPVDVLARFLKVTKYATLKIKEVL